MEKGIIMNQEKNEGESVLAAYGQATFRDLQVLARLQEVLGDPRKRVEVPQTGPGEKSPPLPTSRRYETR